MPLDWILISLLSTFGLLQLRRIFELPFHCHVSLCGSLKRSYVNVCTIILHFSSIFYIHSVGAVGKDGLHASYSSTGAALFLSAPGGDRESFTNNIVALPGGGCQDATIGTSFSTPVAAGVVALVLQANPDLSWRDVQGILATTSQKMDADDPSWSTNAAGIPHSYLYGFGVIDANAAVTAAQAWEFYSSEVQLLAESGPIDLAIPEYPDGPVSSIVSLDASNVSAESVIVYLDITHSSRGDLDVILISPSGTESLVHPGQRPENTPADESWKLMTVRNWNEPANGDWTLRIIDQSAGDLDGSISSTPDVLKSWRLMVYGHASNTGGVKNTSSRGVDSPASAAAERFSASKVFGLFLGTVSAIWVI